jgi:predicted PurR-regulated permease PerM
MASLIALVAVYAILAGILGAVAYSIAKLATVIPDYSQQFQDLYNRVIARLTRFGVGEDQLREIFGKLDVTNFTGVARTLLSTLSSGLSLLLLVVTLIIFVAMDAPSTARRLDWIAQSRPPIAAGLREFGSKVRTYWVVSTVFGLIVAILDGVALQIIDVPLVMTWAVLAFVTNYIPNVGFVIGLIPPALLALLDSGVSKMVAVIIIYASINFVVQTVIQPKLTGDAVGINATTAFVSLVFWAYLLGPLGALLAIPATILVKSTLLDHTSGAQWVSALISSASEPNPVPIPPVQVSTRGHTSPY